MLRDRAHVVALKANGFASMQPAVAGDSIKPGVERSETPGIYHKKIVKPAERPTDVSFRLAFLSLPLSAAPRALQVLFYRVPGVSLRSTPGFMLSPAIVG